MQKILFLKLLLLTLIFSHCDQPGIVNVTTVEKKQPKKRIAPKTFSYHFEKPGAWLKKNTPPAELELILAINRTDAKHLTGLDSIILPVDLTGDKETYLPFPFSVAAIKDIPKIIFFSYPAQVFGAYELGELVYTGPVNMGRKKDPTPAGLYFTNWKAEKTTSTFNDEWDLKWNVNIENKLGIGWHEYELPGYPASHSCLRLQEKDARLLYDWAAQWVIDDKEVVKAQGTPVIVFGNYNFDAPKPWLQLAVNPHALDISKAAIQQEAAPFLSEILEQQVRREGALEGEKIEGK